MHFYRTGLAAPRRFLRTMIAAAFLAAIAGCGTQGEYPTARVHGKVTYNGQPLETGSLLFVPTAGGPSAQGNIDSSGNYVLGTQTETDGAVPGDHKVMITALTGGSPGEATDPNAAMQSVIPDRYGDLEKSGLRATVKPDTDNEVNFELTDK